MQLKEIHFFISNGVRVSDENMKGNKIHKEDGNGFKKMFIKDYE